MSRFLLVDIGAGTMDILYYDTETGLPYKAVVESPVRTVAKRAAGLAGDLVVTGVEMGGGPITDILREKAREAKVIMSGSAAATLHHAACSYHHDPSGEHGMGKGKAQELSPDRMALG